MTMLDDEQKQENRNITTVFSSTGTATAPNAAASTENISDGDGNGNKTAADNEGNAVAPSAVSVPAIDNELAMKCLADNLRSAESKFVLSLFGQSVFNVIHPFFLTRYGVHLVVFNMEWLLTEDSRLKAQCLQYLTFWVNSVIIHTLNDQGKTATIASWE